MPRLDLGIQGPSSHDWPCPKAVPGIRRAELDALVDGIDGILFSQADRGRGRDRVSESLRDGPRGDRVEAPRQLLSERDEPQLAEVEEPGVREDVTLLLRDRLVSGA